MTEALAGRSDRGDTAWQHAPVALLRLDLDGLVLAANDVLLGWVGKERADVVGVVRIGSMLTVGGRIYWETHVGPMLRLHGRVDEVAVDLRGARGRLPVLLSAATGSPSAGSPSAGSPSAGGSVGGAPGGDEIVDVALFAARERSRFEREIVAAREVAERSAERLDVLQAVSSALAPASGIEELVDALLEAVLGRLELSAATVWLVEGDGQALRRRTTRTSGTQVVPAGPHVVPPGGREKVRVRRDGTVVLALRPSSGLRGALVLTPERATTRDPLDQDTLVAVARQASVALGRAALAEQTVSVAHALQRAMLGGALPVDPRLELTTVYRPGVRDLEVGGDWYDAFRLGDDVVGVAVGDVVGRGLAAATAMGQLRTALRALAQGGDPPEVVLDGLHTFVQETGAGLGATVVYAVVDVATGVARFACAGHPPPVLVHPDGNAELLWGGRSMPLGFDRERTGATATLAPGDALVLYTDGVVERRDRHLRVGLEILRRAAGERCREGRPLDESFVLELIDVDAESDDTCLLALTRREPSVR